MPRLAGRAEAEARVVRGVAEEARSAGTRCGCARSIASRISAPPMPRRLVGGVDGDRAEPERRVLARRAPRLSITWPTIVVVLDGDEAELRHVVVRRRGAPSVISASSSLGANAARCERADRVEVRRGSPGGGSQLVLRVAGPEHDALALAGGERDRQVGVAGGELGGRDRQAAERAARARA